MGRKIAGLAIAGLFLFVFSISGAYANSHFAISVSLPDGNVFYNDSSKNLTVFNSGKQVNVPLAFSPTGIATDPSGSRIYVANPVGTLHVFDVASGSEIKRIQFGANISGLAADANGRIYITSQIDSSLSVIDAQSFSILYKRNIPSPGGLCIDNQNHRLFVTNLTARMIQMLDSNSLSALNSTTVDYAPKDIIFNSRGSKLYVRQDSIVTILDATNLKEVSVMNLEGRPKSIFQSADQTRLYVAYSTTHSIGVYDTRSDSLDGWFDLGSYHVKGSLIDTNHWIFDGNKMVLFNTAGQSVSEDEYHQASHEQTIYATIPPDLTPGPELLLNNDHKKGSQDTPYVDFDSNGNWTATWGDLDGFDGDSSGIIARNFNSDDVPTTGSFVVNKGTSGGQGSPSVGSMTNGDFVVGWRDDGGHDGDLKGVFFRRFNSNGSAKDGSDHVGSTKTDGNQYEGALDVQRNNGDFVVVFSQKKVDDTRDIFAHRFNSDGTEKASEQQVNTTTVSHQYAPVVAIGNDGKFVVVWRHNTSTSDTIRARIYNSNGTAAGNDFGITSGGSRQFAPWVAMDANDNFVVAWQENDKGGTQYRLFDINGNALTGQLRANEVAKDCFAPAVSMAPSGEFAVIWRSSDDEFVRHFDANGNPTGASFAPALTGGNQFAHYVGIDDSGNFIATWKQKSYGPDGDGSGVVARRFDVQGAGLNVSCSANPTGGVAPQSVDFTSNPTGGSGTYTYVWDFNDDTITDSTSKNPSFLYLLPGTFHPKVTVDDGSTQKSCTTADVTITTPPVSVSGALPSSKNRGDSNVNVSITGGGFVNGATVTFNDAAIVVNTTTWQNAGQIDVNITVGAGAFQGLHIVTVTNPDTSTGSGSVFTVFNSGGTYAPASITPPVNPTHGAAGATLNVIITGTDFAKDAATAVNFGAGITVNNVAFNSATQLTVTVSIDLLATQGARDITVTNPGTTAATCSSCFSVDVPLGLSLILVSPASVSKNVGQIQLTLNGSGFTTNSKASVRGTGITKVSQQFIDAATIKLTISIDASSVNLGFHKVKVKNSKTEVVTREDLFQIN